MNLAELDAADSSVRPFHVLGHEALSAIESAARTALAVWTEGWLPASRRAPAMRVRAVDAEADATTASFECFQAPGGRLWVRDTPADRLALTHASLGDRFIVAGEVVDDWAAALARQAWSLRNDALRGGLLGARDVEAAATTHGPLDPMLFQRGSGCVVVESAAIGLMAFGDSGLLRHVSPRRGALGRQDRVVPVPVQQAIAHRTVRLELGLGSVHIDLAALSVLEATDVIRFAIRLDEGLPLHCDGRLVAHALLGRRGNNKCAQVVSAHPNTAS